MESECHRGRGEGGTPLPHRLPAAPQPKRSRTKSMSFFLPL